MQHTCMDTAIPSLINAVPKWMKPHSHRRYGDSLTAFIALGKALGVVHPSFDVSEMLIKKEEK